jgi:ribosomal-protein-alanine N-acetyltransferase
MKTVDTANLVLRPMETADVPAYAAFRSDPQVMRYLPAAAREGDQNLLAAQRIPAFAEHWRQRGYGIWGVFERSSGALIGHCGLNHLEDYGETEVLYALARRAWGRGLATEAARAAVDFGFGPAGLPRIIALVHPDNVASQRVLAKLGLTYKHDLTFAGMRVRYYQRDRDKR